MIDLMREQQNEYGFIPSQAGSTWLKTDYGIAPDTTTPASTRISGWRISTQPKTSGVTGWFDKTRKYADFSAALPSSITATFGAGDDEGWLVQITGTRTESPRRHTLHQPCCRS